MQHNLSAQSQGILPQSSEIKELLATVKALLQDSQPGAALEAIARAKLDSPWISNAQGLCQLRLGNAQVAVHAFRSLVLTPGGFSLRKDVPTVFKANYATALLATNNMGGSLGALQEIRDENHPAVRKLRTILEQWKRGLSFWQKLNWYLGGQPEKPIVFELPPGDLE